MKKSFLFLFFTLLMGMNINGYATWHGVKKDTNRTWDVVRS